MTKNLIHSASEKERNMVRRCTNALLKRTWKHKANWGLKLTLATMFLYNLCKANESNNLNNLRKGKEGCELQFYRSSMISFGLLGATMILI